VWGDIIISLAGLDKGFGSALVRRPERKVPERKVNDAFFVEVNAVLHDGPQFDQCRATLIRRVWRAILRRFGPFDEFIATDRHHPLHTSRMKSASQTVS
jgi:hypothetical protein